MRPLFKEEFSDCTAQDPRAFAQARGRVYWLSRRQLRRCAVAHRWGDAAKILFGDGDFAVISHCHDWGSDGAILVSLHPASERAEEVKRELDKCGCSRDWMLCKGEHEIIDLRTGFPELCEYLVQAREYMRAVEGKSHE